LGTDTLSAPERLLPERLLVHLGRNTGWSESSNRLFDRVLDVPGAVSGRTFSRRREQALCISPVDPYPQAKDIGSILSVVNVLRNTEQIDLSPVSDRRVSDPSLAGQDCRLSHADAVREGFWLEKIEASVDRGPVLIVCGYLHVDFLTQRVGERGSIVVEKSTFPPDLSDRRPTMVLSPAELEEYLKRHREAGQ